MAFHQLRVDGFIPYPSFLFCITLVWFFAQFSEQLQIGYVPVANGAVSVLCFIHFSCLHCYTVPAFQFPAFIDTLPYILHMFFTVSNFTSHVAYICPVVTSTCMAL
jgi:hypothetical protein